MDFGGVPGSAARRDEVEPLTAGLRRLHVTVSRQFTRKLDAARDGLAHAIPHASIEQALEAALDLLLEKQARARGQVKRPRKAVGAPVAPAGSPGPDATGTDAAAPRASEATTDAANEPTTEPTPPRRDGPREAIPAAVRRAAWTRDGGRCCWPLDSGGRCGSTHRLELDHVVPWAEWGGESEANLRVVCRAHNRLAARQRFGDRCVARYAGGGVRGAG